MQVRSPGSCYFHSEDQEHELEMLNITRGYWASPDLLSTGLKEKLQGGSDQ